MSKAKLEGWTFIKHSADGVIGQKAFSGGTQLREVHGKTQDEAEGLAAEIDQFVAQREKGAAEQAAVAADALRAQADALEGK